MRTLLMGGLLALVACAPAAPPRSEFDGPGFGGYAAAREAELRGTDAGAVLVQPRGPEVITGNDLAAAGIGTGSGPVPGSGTGTGADAGGIILPPAAATPVAPAAPGGNVGISDEQDFGAVSSRESIQSDAERIAAQRQAYRVIEPEPVPDRPRDTGPNIVAYALSTRNRPGEQVYSRAGFNAQNRFQRNCARYATSDLAQEAFLAAGGPQRDRMGLDPDGDGFACYWDPRPFRAARGG